ncbi:DUF4180 domain-containing protein [Mumia zhuanghuii]|uniref:DUF4180 domain-containing protein n=1 Tax=Mumia zhuanghuii TaxID=2585211 RepID=A0A5C4N5G1_9ACTN|nr:DUF4180 domain-containing protein [Mumia zhuanghuii]TNC51768.1 DUF4180 domain-containing protein [Mumia zhuanghuii]TNC52120.1 DUF4180 domain-containing protein [Mumia zhuanghuii]
MRTAEYGDVRVLLVDPDGPSISSAQDALDLVGEAFGREAQMIAVPVERFSAEFFRLRSGLLGEVTQKLVNYRVRLAVLGDVSEQVAASDAFRDYVREADRSAQTWFVADEAALAERLSPV